MGIDVKLEPADLLHEEVKETLDAAIADGEITYADASRICHHLWFHFKVLEGVGLPEGGADEAE